jgi:predicted DNA binding CopG/RHH family protein
MKKLKLPPVLTRNDFDSDEEYQEYLDIENSDWEIPPLDPARKAELEEAARNTLKRKRISIMVRERDLEKLKAKAAKLGMPYQTLINSILHQYAEAD